MITGSHNLGSRASSNNDENMLMIRGDQGIAIAYAAHVMDVFEHYRSRWISAHHKGSDYDPRTDPNWQQKYFDNWRPAFAERLFWVSGGASLPPLAPNPKLKGAAEGLAAAAQAKKEAAAARRAAKRTRPSSPKKARVKKIAAKKVPGKKRPDQSQRRARRKPR